MTGFSGDFLLWICFLFSSPMTLDSYRILLLPQCTLFISERWKALSWQLSHQWLPSWGQGISKLSCGRSYAWLVGWSFLGSLDFYDTLMWVIPVALCCKVVTLCWAPDTRPNRLMLPCKDYEKKDCGAEEFNQLSLKQTGWSAYLGHPNWTVGF